MPVDRRGSSLRADNVAEAVAGLVAQRGRLGAIKMDNGNDFAGKATDGRAYENRVGLDFSVVRRRTMRWWISSTTVCGRSV